jgi:uncharacterized protein YegP (UPF0339 family)
MKAHVTIYKDKAQEWRWRVVANGHVMADSGEGYTRRRAAMRAWTRLAQYVAYTKFTVAVEPSK